MGISMCQDTELTKNQTKPKQHNNLTLFTLKHLSAGLLSDREKERVRERERENRAGGNGQTQDISFVNCLLNCSFVASVIVLVTWFLTFHYRLKENVQDRNNCQDASCH